MNDASLTQQILDCEHRYWKAMSENDVERAMALTRFPCTVSGPQGARTIGMEEYRKMMKAHDGAMYAGVALQNPQVQSFTDDSALITYSVEINGMTMLDASFWVREDKGWVCGYHSEFPQTT